MKLTAGGGWVGGMGGGDRVETSNSGLEDTGRGKGTLGRSERVV